MIHFLSEDVEIPISDQTGIRHWIQKVVAFHEKKLGEINYIFCSDEAILQVNQRYLQHDYYTDIITFDYTEGERLSGDLFIGIETVASNAQLLNVSYEEELHRVLIHGILHLCGFKDKQANEEKTMREKEREALELRDMKACQKILPLRTKNIHK